MAVEWLDEPEDDDFDSAADYLSMLAEHDVVEKTVGALRKAELVERKAKDILRAARLELLSPDNASVTADLRKIVDGERLAPILLVRGDALRGMQLEVADGYHRVCASYVISENVPIPCRLVSWQT